MTTSSQRPSRGACFSYTPTSRKPCLRHSARLALLNRKMRDSSFQNPSRSASLMSAAIKHVARPPVSPVAADVNGEFANAAITMSRRVRTGAGPSYNIAIDFGNNRRVTTGDGLKPGALIRRGPQIGLKRADPVLDALIVDSRNRDGVVQRSDANLQAGCDSTPLIMRRATCRRNRGLNPCPRLCRFG